MSKSLRSSLGFLLGFLLLPAYAEELTVAVAANFAATMEHLATDFEKASGHKLKLSFGSTGKFYAQIQNGAPFQVFFSADQATPAKLENEGLGVAGSRFTYAKGALALWSAKVDAVDNSAKTLQEGKFNKLALANPKLAPYGAAAVEVLDNLKIKNTTQSKWVMGENIAQTYQFVSTGNAELGFVALSQIMVHGKIQSGSAWLVPKDLYNPIRQDAILLRAGKDSRAAQELFTFMRSPDARKLIESYGYTVE